jgi:ubiquinone/menaquinone biosynthesis C-methylase UbiE
MKKNINFLKSCPKVSRNIGSRLLDKDKYREIALEFGFMYFDGPREYGYGGYIYDGRWVSVAKEIVREYDIKPGDRLLDIGCAKGFLLRDLMIVCPGLEVFGIDISDYAVSHCHPDVVGRVHLGNATSLPFSDLSFDVVLSINTLHNLSYDDCMTSLGEINRVCKRNSFIQVDAYRNSFEKEVFENWMLTAKTYLEPSMWLQLFSDAKYNGDYDWTIITSN